MKFRNKMNAIAHRTLPASANPIIGRIVGTKTVSMRLGSRNEICEPSRSRIVSGALFYGRAYLGGFVPAGLASLSGLPTRYSPTTKNSFDRRAFNGGLI